MQIVTNARNLELTQAIKDYVLQKLSRLEQHFNFIQEVHVILELEKNPRIHDNQLAEATIHVSGAVIRVEAASESLYASIDLLADKCERALRKHKTRLSNRTGKTHTHDTIRKEPESVDTDGDLPDLDEDDDDVCYVSLTEEN